MSIKQVWNCAKALCKDGRRTLIFVPNRNYMMELAHEVVDDTVMHVKTLGLFCVQLEYENRTVKLMVCTQEPADLVCRVKEQLLGSRNNDIIFLDPISMSTALKHELKCVADTFMAKMSIVVDK